MGTPDLPHIAELAAMAPMKAIKKPAAAPQGSVKAALPQYVKDALTLPAGWKTITTKRLGGKYAGHVDVKYLAPDGSQYKSLKSVLEAVEKLKKTTPMKAIKAMK